MARFGSNHRIEIHLRSNGILIRACTSAYKDPEEILYGQDDLFADMLKKALLLHVIRYNRFMTVSNASVLVNDAEEDGYSMKETGLPLVYSLSEGRLREPFTREWNTAGVSTKIAGTSKSSYDGRLSAVHALLSAKSDRYEFERFTYYWMAMNGLYNYIAAEGEKKLKEYGAKGLLGGDGQKQDFLDRCYGYEPVRPGGKDSHDCKHHKKRILWHILPVIRSVPLECIDDFAEACISSDESNEYVRRVLNAVNRMNTKYDYQDQYPVFPLMVVWLPYQIRCGAFHGENALPTFCYSDDKLLNTLRVINRILDKFLTTQLAFWLDSDEQTRQTGMLENAALNPAYKTGR